MSHFIEDSVRPQEKAEAYEGTLNMGLQFQPNTFVPKLRAQSMKTSTLDLFHINNSTVTVHKNLWRPARRFLLLHKNITNNFDYAHKAADDRNKLQMRACTQSSSLQSVGH